MCLRPNAVAAWLIYKQQNNQVTLFTRQKQPYAKVPEVLVAMSQVSQSSVFTNVLTMSLSVLRSCQFSVPCRQNINLCQYWLQSQITFTRSPIIHDGLNQLSQVFGKKSLWSLVGEGDRREGKGRKEVVWNAMGILSIISNLIYCCNNF